MIKTTLRHTFLISGLSLASLAPVAAQQLVYSPAAQAALSTLSQLRMQCDNTAWTLFYSNDYKKWRAKGTSLFSMNYSYSVPRERPKAPADMPEALRARFDAQVKEAMDTLNKAGPDFRDLATYINAKDFEDDGFKKGDALNAGLLTYGETCHRLTKDLQALYAEYAALLIEGFGNDAAKAALAAQLLEDLRAVQALAAELSKGAQADRAAVETMVAALSQTVDTRKAALPADTVSNAQAVKDFYLGKMEEDVAVPMRKMLRETKNKPKAWADELTDRPRSFMMRTRNSAYVEMPGEALDALK